MGQREQLADPYPDDERSEADAVSHRAESSGSLPDKSGSPSDETVLDWLKEGSDSQASAREPVSQNSDGDSLHVGPPSSATSIEDSEAPLTRRRPRRIAIPLLLFLLTCVSTFLVGATLWAPIFYFLPPENDHIALRRMLITHWQDGLVYMAAVIGILLAHEMGHFVATLRHRIAASWPFFLPLPISPIGTLGAVIGMDGLRANRKQIFDIGIAGPLAGLLVCIPILWAGIWQLDLTDNRFGMYQFDMPLIVRWMVEIAGTPGYAPRSTIWQGQLNPLLMAGWVGLLVTGLNMMPVSQLDGGHVIYTLFGRSSRWIGRVFMLAVIGYVVISGKIELTLMIGLILLIGTDHPPTSDDSVRLGWLRMTIGYLSLLIPVLCFPPRLIIIM